MNRHGAALLMVLWFLALASGIALTLTADARLGIETSGNRIAAGRGRWAMESCLARTRVTFDHDHAVSAIDSLPLANGTWCRTQVIDPGAFLNVNTATLPQLRTVLGSDSVAAAVVDWIDADALPLPLGAERSWYAAHGRPLPPDHPIVALPELLAVRGMDPARLRGAAPSLTTEGSGRIDVNTAAVEVLALLPGMNVAFARRIVADRGRGRPLGDLDDLLSRAPPGTRGDLLDAYTDLAQMTSFTPEQYLVAIQGFDHQRLAATEEVTIVPVGLRVAVVRKEVW